jgi:hypothetical protein
MEDWVVGCFMDSSTIVLIFPRRSRNPYDILLIATSTLTGCLAADSAESTRRHPDPEG